MKITHLTIFTSRIQEQADFYQNTLGLTLTNKTEYAFDIIMRYSILQFSNKKSATPYHFAINIPSNKDIEALNWLKPKVEILKDGDRELINFKTWNAKSMYFYDKDKNIVELISRKNLKINNDAPFDSNQLLGISEIGLPVQNISDAFKQINSIQKINIYDGSFDRFCAAGDEYGLFIIIDRNKKKWFPCNDIAYSSDFILRGDIDMKFEDCKIMSYY